MRVVLLLCTTTLLASCGFLDGDGGGRSTCDPSHLGTEVCDKRDNDCNGVVDDHATCPNGYSCIDGSCACGKSTCGDPPSCVDLATNVKNCGACGHPCGKQEVCNKGACRCPFDTYCDGVCTDPMHDSQNCGACGYDCPVAGSICDSGVCKCRPGDLECNNECVDTETSRMNCSACGSVCAVACSNGECDTVVEVATGGAHSCALLSKGETRCWGADDSYQLGDTLSGDANTPLPKGIFGVKHIAAGSQHTCALMTDGTVSCWGYNAFGQVGDGTTTSPAKEPRPVQNLANVDAIALGDTHSCAHLTNGTIACWGSNSFGELGDGTTTTRSSPVTIGNVSVDAIATGAHHTCARKSDGSVFCWGSNDYGELGDGSGVNRSQPTKVPSLVAQSIAAGGAHTCAQTSSGWFCWGRNTDRALGDLGDTVTTPQLMTQPGAIAPGTGNVCYVNAGVTCIGAFGTLPSVPIGVTPAVGGLHMCANVANTVRCWGSNTRGQCGIGPTFTTKLVEIVF